MTDDTLVIDAVVHPFNTSPENMEIALQGEASPLYVKDAKYALASSESRSDFPIYAAAHALFVESDVDMGILHALPRFSFTKGPLCALEKVVGMRDRWPDRFLLYGCLDTLDVDEAIKSLQYQVEELHIDGLKLYPVLRYQGDGPLHGWKMDDRDYAMPILEAASDLGIRNVAIHKIIPVGGGMEFFHQGDLETPLQKFPNINFHVVHAGYSFLEEFRSLFEVFPNLYANLENTAGYAVVRPRLFAEILGELLYWGSVDRICFASGITVMHPRPGLEAMRDFEMPKDLIEGFGYPEVTDEMKQLMVGGNIIRVHDIDVASVREKIRDDEFSVLRRDGIRPPWSGLRERVGEAAPA